MTMMKENSLQRVKQIALEYHFYRRNVVWGFEYYFKIMRAVENMGFRRWSAKHNIFTHYNSTVTGKERYFCWEVVYLNIKWLTDAVSDVKPK